jgi:hypothetical protein
MSKSTATVISFLTKYHTFVPSNLRKDRVVSKSTFSVQRSANIEATLHRDFFSLGSLKCSDRDASLSKTLVYGYPVTPRG